MSYCDIALIIRGYQHRNILSYQLQRITAYGTFHAFTGDKAQKGPDGWLPLYFDKYKKNNEPILSEEQVKESLAEMKALKELWKK